MNDNRERLTRCFSAVFPELNERRIASASPKTVAAWDSIATVTLVSVIEEQFGIGVEPAAFDRLVSFSSILSYVEELTASSH
jgi:acyl carrier protein